MKGRIPLRLITACAMMAALSVVLNRFCSIHTAGWTIGFAFVPVALIAIVYGPTAGAVVGGLADLIGALLFPFGSYHPGFTVIGALMGAVYGWFLYGVSAAAIMCVGAGFAGVGLGLTLFGTGTINGIRIAGNMAAAPKGKGVSLFRAVLDALKGGLTAPGTAWLVAGVIALAIGVALLVIGILKKRRKVELQPGKTRRILRILTPALINNLLLGLFVNTVWVSQLYGSRTYWGWFVYRLPEYAVLVPLNLILLPVLIKLAGQIKKYR